MIIKVRILTHGHKTMSHRDYLPPPPRKLPATRVTCNTLWKCRLSCFFYSHFKLRTYNIIGVYDIFLFIEYCLSSEITLPHLFKLLSFYISYNNILLNRATKVCKPKDPLLPIIYKYNPS